MSKHPRLKPVLDGDSWLIGPSPSLAGLLPEYLKGLMALAAALAAWWLWRRDSGQRAVLIWLLAGLLVGLGVANHLAAAPLVVVVAATILVRPERLRHGCLAATALIASRSAHCP